MRVLVAGGDGQVGRAIDSEGIRQGLDVIGLGRADLNITELKSINDAIEQYQPKLIINAAAYTAVDKAEIEFSDCYLINKIGPGLLAEACAKTNIPLLHISTDYVFDGVKEGPYTENDEVNPLAVYAKSKEAGERAVRDHLASHIILRTSWVFSENGNNFVKTMLRLAKDRTRISVVSDQFGGPSSARAIAQALIEICKSIQMDNENRWGTYHFSQKPYVSWYEFAIEIINQARSNKVINNSPVVLPITSDEFSTPVKRPKNSCLDTTKIEQEFGIETSFWYDDISYIRS
jgi:dTDP-4-dehydrorhamnose reductase